MFELPVKYNVEYNESGFEIIQPVILNNRDAIFNSTTHDFYFLKENNACFLANYKSINEKIMNALLDNKKVFISKDINYHYINDTDIQILENENENDNNIESGYYLYMTKNLNNEYYVFYMSDKKISFWTNENNLILNITKDVYNTLLSLHKKYPYSYFIINNIQQQKITTNDIILKHFYLSNDALEEQDDISSDNIKINPEYLYLTEPTYVIIKYFMNKNLLNIKNIKRNKKFMNMISFIQNNFYKIDTIEDIFNDTIPYKTISELIELTGYEKNTILCVFKQDPSVVKIQLYNFINKNKKSSYVLYSTDIHKTQFISYQYLNCCSLYNLRYIEKNIISNSILLDSSNNVIPENISLNNIDNMFTFNTMEDMILYHNIDLGFLKINIINGNRISVDVNTDNINNTYVALLPYYGEKKLAILKISTKEEIEKNNYEYTCVNDTAILDYINHIESKNLLPVIKKENDILQNILLNSIMVITPEMKTLEEKKQLVLEKIKQNIYIEYNSDIDLFEFTNFVKMIEELSLYGIFINIPDKNDFNKIESDIKTLTVPEHKKNKLLTYFKIIQHDYYKYNKIQEIFINLYFNVYIELEQINDMEELDIFIKKIQNKYLGEIM